MIGQLAYLLEQQHYTSPCPWRQPPVEESVEAGWLVPTPPLSIADPANPICQATGPVVD